ncbi:MAG: tetratricopeptide repeat protein [Tepidisphaeraceae bacterium]|jgi:predicted O-linked N-acetylglucosamine transferase (SPINDLY family)
MSRTIHSMMTEAVGLHQRGRLGEAEPIYREVLAANPSEPDALHLLGVLLSQTGRFDEAIGLLERAAELRPRTADVLSNFAIALAHTGKEKKAADYFRLALGLQPNHPDANFNLGNLLDGAGELDQAIPFLRKAAELQPGNILAWEKLGDGLRRLGKLEEALGVFQRVAQIAPRRPEIHNYLGVTLAALGRTAQAVEAFGSAIRLKPDYADPHSNLGLCLQSSGETQRAIDEFETAIRLRPNFPAAYNNLAILFKEGGQLDRAIEAYRKALVHQPNLVQGHDNLLLALHAHPDYDAAAIFREHSQWNRNHAQGLERKGHGNSREADRRLKIGYVSPDFREHSVGAFLEGLLANHDPSQVEIFCYSDAAREDLATQRFKMMAHHWRNLIGLSDEQVAEMIRRDGIDILIDLAGHTADNRLLVFARKPAPVQVTYLGYPATSGLTAMDWRLTDAWADPAGESEAFHSEKLMRLPRTFLCFTPPAAAPAVGRLPALANGGVTFGSFNYLPKINPGVVEVWSEILRQVPGSRLLIKSQGLSDEYSRRGMMERFAARGIEPQRLELLGKIPTLTSHLQAYERIDVGLDPFPYNGTTTTCEALWMGVPVVTLAGKMHAGRVGVSLLSCVGLPRLIAKDRSDYVRIAAELAGDLPGLGELREGLRQRVDQSPLTDAGSFARDMEAAFRGMWREYVG